MIPSEKEDERPNRQSSSRPLDRERKGPESRGDFVSYTLKQRDAVLSKGFLGRWPPDEAIRIAKRMTERGYALRTSKFVDRCELISKPSVRKFVIPCSKSSM